jgi:hypothetical protein
MTAKLSPESGPLGTPITVEGKGIGWLHLQNSYVLLYDNNFTGFMSTVTTGGSAAFTIPAAGKPGVHVLELLQADFTFAYRNMQQSPDPDPPRFALQFRITPDAAALPPPPERQVQANMRGLPEPGELVVSPRFSAVDQPVVVSGTGFEVGKSYELHWTTLTGNRVAAGGGGWEESSKVRARATPPAKRSSASTRRTISAGCTASGLTQARARKRRCIGSFPLDAGRGLGGTPFKIHLKGGLDRDRQHLQGRLRQQLHRLRVRL